jgi:hypothetical protein
MPSVGLEPTIPAIKKPQTYALDHMAIGIDGLMLLARIVCGKAVITLLAILHEKML